LAQIDVSNNIGLIYMREFVVAEVELLRIARLEHQVVFTQQQQMVRKRSKTGFRQINYSDHDIAQFAPGEVTRYFTDPKQRAETVKRYGVADLMPSGPLPTGSQKP
jgi:hypothetical protein